MKRLKDKDWMSSHKSYPRFVLIQEASGKKKKKKKKCDKVSLNTGTMQQTLTPPNPQDSFSGVFSHSLL